MSEENAPPRDRAGVRTPVTVSAKSRRRTLDERLFVLFPVLVRALLSAWSRLPPRSRLRRAWLSRIIRQGCEAANRRDFDLLLLPFDPEIEYHANESSAGGFVAPDLLGVHRGHEGYLRIWEAWIEAMEDFKLEHEEVIDYGDRLLAAGRATGHGSSSGVPVNQPIFQVFTLRRGLVIRQEDFDDRDKALEAAGLRE
jgi:ketosteroid isomerase-like protein